MSPAAKPVTSIVYGPGAMVPTVNVKAVNTPVFRNVHKPGVPAEITAGVGLEICGQGGPKAPISAGANPLPVTVTTVPTGPEVGLSLIVGAEAVTVNVASAISPTVIPVTKMKYGPGRTVPTVNLNESKTPLGVNVHASTDVRTAGVELEICGQGATKEKASEEAKPLPETVTTVPTGPDVGLSVIVGPVTVKVA